MSYQIRSKRTIWTAALAGIALMFGTLNAIATTEADLEETEMAMLVTNHVVTIKDLQYSPAVLQVKKGDEITWINKDFVPHTVTALDKSWDSKDLAKDEYFSIVVDENTSLDYFCVYHPNMVARIEILPDE